jgi:hypothetical protein
MGRLTIARIRAVPSKGMDTSFTFDAIMVMQSTQQLSHFPPHNIRSVVGPQTAGASWSCELAVSVGVTVVADAI